ncbi:MAG TPA: UbiA family prenyltransferase [Nitrososphaera sp.]|nr:UbiA family prenyltransferase [Nitrososphaera sp.]
MQHHVGRLRQYLLLVRLPNVFTAPPDIAAGYFATVAPATVDWVHLAALMISSGLLYIAGIVLNDYFDIEIDRKERPSRPLPSGSISKRTAITIALSALAVANAISLAVGPASLATSLALTTMIIAYNYRLKHTAVGPLAMGGSRFLNIILGASPAIPAAWLAGNATPLAVAVFAAASLFVYVVAITMLSKKEVGSEKPSIIQFSIVFVLIAAIAAVGMVSLQPVFMISLIIFAAAMLVTLRQHIATSSPSVQKAVRNMVISIVILDSIFVSGTAGLPYGLATLLFIAPAVILAKKLYVT